MIEKLTKYCYYYQKYSKSLYRFKFKLFNNLDFNHTVFINIFYIDGKLVLHIINKAIGFTAARFLKDISVKTTWEALRTCQLDTYLSPPDLVVHDAGTNFDSREFRQNASMVATKTKCVPVKAHWSIGKVKRGHVTLLRAYEIIQEEIGSDISREACLQMAVKALNDSTGPNGLVPTLLVFGAFPRMSDSDVPAPSIQQCAVAICKAMEEITKERAKRMVNNILNT